MGGQRDGGTVGRGEFYIRLLTGNCCVELSIPPSPRRPVLLLPALAEVRRLLFDARAMVGCAGHHE